MSFGQFIEIKPQLLKRIESALNASAYRDAIENSSKYNNQLVKERKTRLPFIDHQTRVAQRNCFLWMHRWERMPGLNHGVVYSYPSREWHRKRRSYLINPSESGKSSKESEASSSKDSNIVNIDKIVKNEVNESSLDKYDLSKDNWLHDFGDETSPPDAGEIDEVNSSDSSGEYTPRKRRKKREPTKPKRKVSLCQSQSQHSVPTTSSASTSQPPSSRNTTTTETNEDNISTISTTTAAATTTKPTSNREKDKEKDKDKASPSKYCDFCLGDSDENKKTSSAEKMISCSDCGRSAHPTCLQFTSRMVLSIKKYRWQCIECKSCAVCGTSDNDEQLLFCDDCDRGYHMYCLDPPINEPPEGSWSCKLCIAAYHGKPK
ncbi:zinc finger protein ubi-d4-like isoform X2 [Panonychus citri]|uniref:zinc finger protein ubi-d4-like isoform X2 n=1 Tax=Panonychus citri TaxID=50023 RepID=UPI00230752FD|nr:zinc finger protein ubi-d4-like isoform X2 [Panonychus citri]